MTIAKLVHKFATTYPKKGAIWSPTYNILYDFATVSRLTQQLAGSLSAFGYKPGDVIVSDIPNTHHNFLLQSACSHLGVAVATAKNEETLHDMIEKGVKVRGALAASSDSFLCGPDRKLLLPPIAAELGDNKDQHTEHLFGDMLQRAVDVPTRAHDDPDCPAGYFGSSNPLTCAEVARLGEDAANNLNITEQDISCVSVSLFHSFGIATGVASTLMAGGTVMLPAVGGIRGCGDPAQRAQVTRDALVHTNSTLLFGDSHTIKALEPLGVPEGLSLRSGLIKVASGTSFLDPTISYAGVTLRTMGKNK
mmetsp:Transcript_29864/g.65283  ORF Transcript_29864/g.65283 Transcript_29864/m.65283 type:complete len:307 (-) Transcript_29864:886-1806(-)